MYVISMGKLEPRNGLNINDLLRNTLNSVTVLLKKCLKTENPQAIFTKTTAKVTSNCPGSICSQISLRSPPEICLLP